MTELLAPAGNMESFKAAIAAGADAVYVGGMQYGARAYADNFSQNQLLEAIRLAHLHHKKIYLTVNTLIREQELALLPAFLRPFYEEGLDGVIIADTGAIRLLHELFADLPLHASTQMTLTGPLAAQMLKPYGVTRIVPARELSLDELAYLKAETDLELEVFIHGAMCYAYSGQCLFSSMLGRRSGNRGRCAGACRLPYQTLADDEPLSHAGEDYQLSLKDLCALPVLGRLMDMGIDSFKIEGRMKSPEYVYFVTSLYRRYMDKHVPGKDTEISDSDLLALQERFNRGSLQTGYFQAQNGRSMVLLSRAGYTGSSKSETAENADGSYETAPIPVKGELYLEPGKTTRYLLKVAGEKHFEVSVSGAAAELAQNAPVREEDFRERFAELGNTPYRLTDFSLYFRNTDAEEFAAYDEKRHPALFYPVKVIKELKRQAAEELTALLLKSRHRECSEALLQYLDIQKNIKPTLTGSLRLTVRQDGDRQPARRGLFGSGHIAEPEPDTAESFRNLICVRTMEQLKAIDESLYPAIDGLVLSYDLVKVRGLKAFALEIADGLLASGTSLYLSLPIVSRRIVMEEYTSVLDQAFLEHFSGIVCANLESIAFLRNRLHYQGEIVTDAGLYLFQSESARFYEDLGIRAHILPYELQKNEIAELLAETRSLQHSFYLPVYGYIPVMVSAGCLRNTNKACLMELPSAARRQKEVMRQISLKDRMNKRFPVVLHCDRCEYTIYNSVPLSLHRERQEIKRLPLSGQILSFTVENAQQTKNVLAHYLAGGAVPAELKDFTKGHFLKGVE